MNLEKVSVVVPVGVGDSAWESLYFQSRKFLSRAEVLFAFAELPVNLPEGINAFVCPEKGRAKQLNFGAQKAQRDYLCFLHADTVLNQEAVESLGKKISESPEALLYFNLHFEGDGPSLMWLNSIGLWFRSHFLGIPFGDQAFTISRSLFEKVGGFNEQVPYGEDHLFVWKARELGIPLVCTGAWIATSARKYKEKWGRVTLDHVIKTYSQALPEFQKQYLKKGK